MAAPDYGDEKDARALHSLTADRVMLYNADGYNIFFQNTFRRGACFLLCPGPSLGTMNLSALQQRGILTMGLNNSPAVFKPQLWTCVDHPGHFIEQVWKDSTIWKFVPLAHFDKPIRTRDREGVLKPSAFRVRDCPAVFGFKRNERFRAEHFLTEPTFNWGNHSLLADAYGRKGSRSVLLVALKLLWYLGVRTVYLLGCDFRMEPNAQNYCFDQARSPSSVRGNNNTYSTLNVRLRALGPHFQAEGFKVINCTPNSGLTAFPMMDFERAVADVARECNEKPILTAGVYDT